MAYTHLNPGSELEVSEHIYSYSGCADMPSLVKLSVDELKQLEQSSVDQEKAIYSRVLNAVQEWTQQAGRTMNLRKAQEYLKIPPPDHTANQWIVNQYGNHEMSNMVYKFFWREYERIEWDRVKEQSVPVAWEITWNVTFNTPQNPDYSGRGRQIAGQDKKVFKDRAAMEKYLQGRISAYAHLFTEISPPIPEEHKKRFFVNGVLLPGYTVETPQLTQPDPNTVDDLLSYLDDDDMPSFQQPEEPPAPAPSKAAAKKKSAPKKSGPVR